MQNQEFCLPKYFHDTLWTIQNQLPILFITLTEKKLQRPDLTIFMGVVLIFWSVGFRPIKKGNLINQLFVLLTSSDSSADSGLESASALS